MQLKVTEGEIGKLTACIDSVGTRDDFRRFGTNIFDLIDGILVEAQAAADPFLNLSRDSRTRFEEDFKERQIQECPIPTIPPKPEAVPEDYNPPIPTIPEQYIDRLEQAGISVPTMKDVANDK